ncbi:MAG: recombinase family protein [Actinomycetia bacterium]|nr:recombinase family protein [Actinomycetes bacterium]
MKALGVARVSTQEQAAGDRFSIPHQRQRIAEYAARQGWDLVDVVEYVRSGGSNSRDLAQILERVRREGIGVLIVNELDRLARDMISTLLFLEDLQRAGCRFVSVSDDLDLTTPDGELKMMVLSVFAHYFRRQLARKVKGGLAERARAGRYHGGRPPYGYRVEAGRLVPEPGEAEVVRTIFRWYVEEGAGSRTIAKRLNARGVPSPGGLALWDATAVRQLLRRPAYVGDLVHGAIEWERDRLGRSHRRRRPDPLVVRDAHPALVDRATFERAQRLLAARGAGSGRRTDSPYLLSGLVFCALCGRPLTPVRAPRRAPRYVCRRYQGGGGCTAAHARPVEAVEAAVVTACVAAAGEPAREWVAAVLQEAYPDGRTERAAADPPRSAATARARLDEALAAGFLSLDRYRAAVARLERRGSQGPGGRRDDPAREASGAPVSPDEVMAGWATLAERFRRGPDVAARREILRRYVARVDVGPDTIVVEWRGDPDGP